MLVVNGWQIFAHPLFLDQIERLTAAVEGAKAKHPEGFQKSANAYRQGGTLGANRKHWFRAKFGGQPFRLFFRYDSAVKIIPFAWVMTPTRRGPMAPRPTPPPCSDPCSTRMRLPMTGVPW